MRRTLLTFQAVVSALPRAFGSDGLLDTRARRAVSELLVGPSVCLSVRLPTLHQPPLQAEAPQTAPAQLSSDSKMSPLNSSSCSPGRKKPFQHPEPLSAAAAKLFVSGDGRGNEKGRSVRAARPHSRPEPVPSPLPLDHSQVWPGQGRLWLWVLSKGALEQEEAAGLVPVISLFAELLFKVAQGQALSLQHPPVRDFFSTEKVSDDQLAGLECVDPCWFLWLFVTEKKMMENKFST